MKKLGLQSAGALTLCLMSALSQAQEVSFSIGGGLPFLLTPEVSYASPASGSRWYANYKMGLDDGFSAGYEKALDRDNKHALGIVVGAFAVRDDDRPCEVADNNEDNLASQIGFEIGSALGCALSKAFDDETINGIGLTYSYQFNGLNEAGWRVRFELGHGEGARSKENSTSGGFIASYQF